MTSVTRIKPAVRVIDACGPDGSTGAMLCIDIDAHTSNNNCKPENLYKLFAVSNTVEILIGSQAEIENKKQVFQASIQDYENSKEIPPFSAIACGHPSGKSWAACINFGGALFIIATEKQTNKFKLKSEISPDVLSAYPEKPVVKATLYHCSDTALAHASEIIDILIPGINWANISIK